ncbi:MAG: hypothetical protein U0Q11_19820 [Vicinamibacterales bacterium]
MTRPAAGLDLHAIATAHMQCGLALMQAGDAAALSAAIRHFDRALEIRRLLPSDGAPATFALAASWLNRAEALVAMGEVQQLEQAIDAFSAAIALLEGVPNADPRSLRRLAIALQNRALARGRLRRETWTMAPDLFRALDLLQTNGYAEERQLIAALWVNIGIAQLLEPGDDAWARAAESGVQAMRVIGIDEWTDAKLAEIGLRARYLRCQSAARLIDLGCGHAPALVATAADVAHGALTLIDFWQHRGVSTCGSLAVDLHAFVRRLNIWIQQRAPGAGDVSARKDA